MNKISTMTRLQSFSVLAFLSSSFFLASCGNNTEQNQASEDAATAVKTEVQPVALAAVENMEEFPGAQLSLDKVSATPSNDSVKLSFAFGVKNYELKNQTSDEVSKLCNNSEKGQHIHFILDNKPYVALYEPKHEVTLEKNSEHYMLAFLSRSYHLSIKDKAAAVLYHFRIDENGKLQKLDDPKTPMVFYSRPKGDYLGKDTENLLFDFYVWNTTLGSDNMIKADISSGGRDTSIMITEWKPYFLKNLAMGKNTIKLMMVDKDGKKVEGPNTEVTREISLSKDEPMIP